jgi:hypothetical protein
MTNVDLGDPVLTASQLDSFLFEQYEIIECEC